MVCMESLNLLIDRDGVIRFNKSDQSLPRFARQDLPLAKDLNKMKHVGFAVAPALFLWPVRGRARGEARRR